MRQGKLAEARAEYDEALKHYAEAMKLAPGDASLKRKHAQLAKQWKVQDEAHAAARLFIYQTWPKADLLQPKATVFEDAKKALEACRKAGDMLGPQKLLLEAIAHGTRLQKRREALEIDVNKEDQEVARKIADASKELKQLILDVQAYLKAASEK